MQITRFTDLGLRVLMYLAARPEAMATIPEIAQQFDISRNHLVKVVHRLGQLQLIATTRGKGGGMALARAPGEYRLGDVLRQLEDNPTLIDCASPPCVIRPGCQLKAALDDALQAFFSRLDQYTLEDVLRPPTGASLITLRERAG
ncbi:Rrf2 family transcriptional regulator [Zoogloea sp.]|jgi:Rrf2 family nitric oxide-sensitive transcriptional repressor|uniref:Rrf2 family transcriptional regulator n=1 Tax=Zoogloea sp. TaxID=49181 RepID=UPI0035B164FE